MRSTKKRTFLSSATVFGDVFQLLDRGADKRSEYRIQASEDLKAFLAQESNLGGVPDDYNEIWIPENLYLWASMNSADQGVFPMDTAFKRRWEFDYIGINENEAAWRGKTVVLGRNQYQRTVEWNALRTAINDALSGYQINEDKQMGPYFLSQRILPATGNEIDSAVFSTLFKSKVISYLFDDAAKQKAPTLFAGCEEKKRYSSICAEFDEKGVFIFCEDIARLFPAQPIQTAETHDDNATATETEEETV